MAVGKGTSSSDIVLRHVARAMHASLRKADTRARYRVEQMVLVRPHADLEGSHAIPERIRVAIAGLGIPHLDEEGVLRVTASPGVAASADGDKHALIADADAGPYAAKRQGKNRTVRAQPRTANVIGCE